MASHESRRTRDASASGAAPARTERLLVADDDPIVRDVLEVRLRNLGYTNLAMAADGVDALRAIEQSRPNVLIVDLLMPNLPGMELLRNLSTAASPLLTVVLTSSITREQIVQALQLGARGIVTKYALDELGPALDAVISGRYWVEGKPVSNVFDILEPLLTPPSSAQSKFGLTPRELEVVNLVVQGCSNREISKELRITEETVKSHLTNIFDKVGMSSRLELALFALDHHLVARR